VPGAPRKPEPREGGRNSSRQATTPGAARGLVTKREPEREGIAAVAHGARERRALPFAFMGGARELPGAEHEVARGRNPSQCESARIETFEAQRAKRSLRGQPQTGSDSESRRGEGGRHGPSAQVLEPSSPLRFARSTGILTRFSSSAGAIVS
jgi:hypothetical protein